MQSATELCCVLDSDVAIIGGRGVWVLRPRKKYCLFPVIVWKKNRVRKSVKLFFLHYFFGQKCVFYACFTLIGSWEGGKNFRVGIF